MDILILCFVLPFYNPNLPPQSFPVFCYHNGHRHKDHGYQNNQARQLRLAAVLCHWATPPESQTGTRGVLDALTIAANIRCTDTYQYILCVVAQEKNVPCTRYRLVSRQYPSVTVHQFSALGVAPCLP